MTGLPFSLTGRHALLCGATLAATVPAMGPSTATMSALGTATAAVTLRVDITTSLGTSSDTDTKTVAVGGPCVMRLSPSTPPWQHSNMTALAITLGNATYAFDFFCVPFIGCQHLDLTLTNVSITLVSPVASAVAPGGAMNFVDGQYAVHADYAFTGFTAGSGTSDSVNPSNFASRITPSGSSVLLDQCAISPQVVVLPPESLPSGVDAVTVTITANLANTRFGGPWVVDAHPADLNGDGVIGGLDLTQLLAAWGTAGADINSDGTTDGLDMTEILSAWTP